MLACAVGRSPPPISPNLPPPTTTAILLNLSLKTENLSARLTLRQNLEGLHLCLGGDRQPHQHFSTTVRKALTQRRSPPDTFWNYEL
ncbi:MAG: hypothetical protein SFY66_08725 [Oculatellaceae cyanobacterium bins.114]|nr:hypothetical protein [Oculatellaceae cyanobacterium bins.114]